jgi:ribosomal-protein-alanine N-acetyltransferase
MDLLSAFFAKPTFVVQPIGAERAEDCERLHAASFAFPWSKIDFESYLTDAHVIADGAVNEGGRKAELGGFILSRLTPPDAEVLTFAVDPARRGAGIGRALLDRHLENLERGGARLVFLEVGDDNASALKLYERAGFKTIGRRENYYLRANSDRHAALALRLEI